MGDPIWGMFLLASCDVPFYLLRGKRETGNLEDWYGAYIRAYSRYGYSTYG